MSPPTQPAAAAAAAGEWFVVIKYCNIIIKLWGEQFLKSNLGFKVIGKTKTSEQLNTSPPTQLQHTYHERQMDLCN